MENLNVTLGHPHDGSVEKILEDETTERVPLRAPAQLNEAELHALIAFFQLLDHWDRELVQNRHEEIEVSLCRRQ